MHNRHIVKKFIGMILSIGLLTGCGFVSDFSVDTLQSSNEEEGPATLGLTPSFD